jgi:plastocyanin
MERSRQFWKKSFSIGFIVLVGPLAVPHTVFGIILAPVDIPKVPTGPEEEFPEAHFTAMEQQAEVDASGGNRKPAQLEAELASVKPSSTSRTGVQEVGLIAGDLGFFPKTVFVTRDIPVRLFVTGAAKKPLCFMMDTFQIKKQIRAQKIEEINFTPTQPGQYRFYCPINGMEGTLLVKDISYREKP